MEETAKISKNCFFYKQILDFHYPSKTLCTHRNYEILPKSLVPDIEIVHFRIAPTNILFLTSLTEVLQICKF